MQVDRYKHFKWTPRTAWLSILFAVAIPSSLYYVANKTDVSRFFQCFWTAGIAWQKLEITGEEVEQERGGSRKAEHVIAMEDSQDGLRLQYPQQEALVTQKIGRERWQDGDTSAQRLYHQAPKPRPNSRSTILETTNTNCIICRASTSFAAREEATP
jgi:hypothetical protein